MKAHKPMRAGNSAGDGEFNQLYGNVPMKVHDLFREYPPPDRAIYPACFLEFLGKFLQNGSGAELADPSQTNLLPATAWVWAAIVQQSPAKANAALECLVFVLTNRPSSLIELLHTAAGVCLITSDPWRRGQEYSMDEYIDWLTRIAIAFQEIYDESIAQDRGSQ